MKLNLREIKALAGNIADELNNERETKVKEALKNYKPSAEYKTLAKKIDKYNEIGEFISSTFGVHTHPLLKKDALKSFVMKELNLNTDWISSYTLEDEIIIAQIECQGVDTIVEKIKSKYL